MAAPRWNAAASLVLRAAAAVLLLFGALTLLLEPVDLAAGRHGPDGRNYLSLMHSLLFDRDLLLYNDHALFEKEVVVTPTGYALELHNIGTAVAFLPFYALGHLTCLLGDGVCQGDSLPVYAWLSLGNWAYGLMALVVSYRIAARHAPRRRAALAVVVLAIGSPFLYYWTRYFNPHMPGLLLVALLALVWDRTRGIRWVPHWALMGTLGGLAATVASYNAVFLLLPAADLATMLVRGKRRSILQAGASAILLAAGALAGFAPQLVAWRLLFGRWLGTPYARQLFWLEPGLPDILTSSYHGLFFYTPATLIAVAGFVPLYQRDRRLALGALAAVAAHVYVSSTNIAWWGGASFGARYLLSSLPLLTLPLAVLLDRVRMRGLLYAALALCIAWTYGLFLADFGGLVDPGQYIPPAWQMEVMGRVGADLPALVRSHLMTPRFEGAVWYALPASVVMTGLAWLAGRRTGAPPVRALPSVAFWTATVAVMLPLAAAGALAQSDRAARLEIERLAAAGALERFPRGSADLYDLSEGYWQRGAYRFVRGDLEEARADFHAAQEVDPGRTWVRFHRAGRASIPQPLEWQVDARLSLVGWEAEPGALTLYWLTDGEVLVPSYRTAVRLLDRPGQVGAAFEPEGAERWRALEGEIVRVSYPVGWEELGEVRTLVVDVSAAADGQALGHLEVEWAP